MVLVDAALDHPAHFLLLDQVLVHHGIVFFLLYCSARGKINVLTSFLPSSTTGIVWHCCVERDFATKKQQLLCQTAAAPPAQMERKQNPGRWGGRGARACLAG